MVEKITKTLNEEDLFGSDFDDYDIDEPNYKTDVAEEFEKDITNFLNYIINLSGNLEEEFTSTTNLRQHFNKYCLGHNQNKHSTRGRIYYDFNDNSKYSQYEKTLSEKIERTKYQIGSLYDYDTILRYIKKLFEGNITVRFCNGCGIRRNGLINISFHSFASNVTKNYSGGNTIDVCIKNGSGKTMSLYAIDVHDVERRLNNTLANYSTYNGQFLFNND